MSLPKSIRQIVRLKGYKTSGQARKLVAAEIDSALFAFWERAVEMFSSERAACLLAHVIAKDVSYAPEKWAVAVLRRHKQAILEAFAEEPAFQPDKRRSAVNDGDNSISGAVAPGGRSVF